MGRLELRTISLKDANAYVKRAHRHSAPVVGHKFSLAAWVGDALAGVAIVGRPIASGLEDPRKHDKGPKVRWSRSKN